MADAFSRAWSLVKDEGDTEPDVAFHRSNPSFRSPHFTENLSATNPDTWECAHCKTGRDANYHGDHYTGEDGRKYCSSRCMEGEDPYCASLSPGEGEGVHLCEWEVVGNPTEVGETIGPGQNYQVEIECQKCNNKLWGWVS